MIQRGSVRSWRSRMIAVALLFAINVTLGCTSTEVGKQVTPGAPELRPALTVQWLPPCSINVSEPYFTVDVFADGTVRYVGGPQAREIGERADHISAEDARRLLKEARRFAGGSTGPLGNQSKTSTLDESYCLEVTVKDGSTTRTKRGRSDVKHSQALIKVFDQTVHEKKWVCPSRYGVHPAVDEDLTNNLYCTDPVIARLSFSDRSGCSSGHSIDFFADGTVRYFETQVHLKEQGALNRVEILNQQYKSLGPSELEQWIDLVNGFKLVPDPVCTGIVMNETCNEDNPHRLFRSDDENVANELIMFLNKAVHIKWAELNREHCASPKPFASHFFIEAKYVSRSPGRSQ